MCICQKTPPVSILQGAFALNAAARTVLYTGAGHLLHKACHSKRSLMKGHLAKALTGAGAPVCAAIQCAPAVSSPQSLFQPDRS